jgi:predicted metal-dependent peptidase
MNVDQLRDDIRDIRIYCGRYFPFAVIPLSYLRIVATDKIDTAGVDGRGTLAINPTWWSSLDREEKRFVAILESLHVALCHPFRRKGFDPTIYNIAADGKINHGISESNVSDVRYLRGDEVTLVKISQILKLDIETLEKMSTEEIARELELKIKASMQSMCNSPIGNDLRDGTLDGDVVQDGDSTGEQNHDEGEDPEEKWRRILERARDFAKQAGNMPAALERIVDEVLEVKPPWHIALRFGLRNHSKQDSSFAYPSRRGDEYPGHYGYRYTVWNLIDTSGSITEEELRIFLGIVKHEARNADVYAVPWDAEAYEILSAKNPAEVAKKIAPKMKGGGGTVIKPALSLALRMMRPGDAVIILTDGDISDADESEVQEWFRKVAANAGFALIGYTHTPITAPGFIVTRVEIEK